MGEADRFLACANAGHVRYCPDCEPHAFESAEVLPAGHGHVAVRVELSAPSMQMLRDLHATGLFGATVPEVAQRLVYRALQAMTRAGWTELQEGPER